MAAQLTTPTKTFLWWTAGLLLVARIIGSTLIPLTDTTEARYGEIARKMLETNNWIMPQHDYGVPFWGKPPLSTWLSALSMKLFGVSEFAARLPSLLLGIGMLALVWQWCAARRGRKFAWLVAKGLVVGVFTFVSIAHWIIQRKNWRNVRQALPWCSGTLLMLAISVPWYLLAEQQTPGFLRYFFIGEHFSRFLQPGWHGDKYGNAHAEALGSIWLFWLAAAFPWSAVFIVKALRRPRQLLDTRGDDTGLRAYLLWWSFAPMLFFSFAHNIIWTYPLPALPAFAVLITELLWLDHGESPQRLLALNALAPLLMLVVTGLYLGQSDVLKASQKATAQFYLHALANLPTEQRMLLQPLQHFGKFMVLQERPAQHLAASSRTHSAPG
jgi:4-amino-4-deoxy-L-arabinose transferase-like glycosyltransferase